jgi:uncharacterized membrane protein
MPQRWPDGGGGMTPDWAPNLHPVVVHFPIALLTVAVVIDLLSVFRPRHRSLRDGATWMYLAGTACALAAYFTGSLGADALMLELTPEQPVAEAIAVHETWAFRSAWFFAFLASLRLAVSFVFPARRVILIGAFLLAVVGLAMLAETVEHGAELVYGHGVGVTSRVQ